MRQIVDNFRPVRMAVALVLWALSFVWGIGGELFSVYMTIVVSSLLFFNTFESYLIIAPGLTIVSTLILFGKHLLDNDFLMLTFSMMVFTLLIGGIAVVIRRVVMAQKILKYPEIVNSLSDDKLHFNEEKLRESKLSTFFKGEMRKYYKSYQYLQSVKDLMEHKVDSYDKDLTMIHAIFNELIDSPRMLLKMNDFLYSHLKDYVDKVKAIVDLDDNVVESDEDKQLVENAKDQLATISHQFRDDFIQVTEDERDALKE